MEPWRFTDVRSVLMGESEAAKEPLQALLAYSLFQPTVDKIKERLKAYQEPDVYMYACVDDTTYLGLIVYRLCEQTATVLDIAVCEHERGRGIGSFLIDRLLWRSHAAAVIAVTDDEAIGFYEAYGFVITDTDIVLGRKRYTCRYIPLEIKTLTRDTWSRVLSRTFRFAERIDGNLRFVAGLLTIGEVTAPLKKTMFDNELIIADSGYHWLQIAPEGDSWWLTAMIDPDGNIVQYYFDVTDRNILDGEQSRFYDLYLDVVVLPNGKSVLLDQDELDAALQDKVITQAQYQKALDTSDRLLREVPPRLVELHAFVRTIYNELAG